MSWNMGDMLYLDFSKAFENYLRFKKLEGYGVLDGDCWDG